MSAETESLLSTIRRQARRAATSNAMWLVAAERALTAMPGASNSTHPAHSLWLRVEMAKAPAVDVVLSA